MYVYTTKVVVVRALSRLCPTYPAISRDFRFRRRPTQETASPRLLRSIARSHAREISLDSLGQHTIANRVFSSDCFDCFDCDFAAAFRI